LHVLLQCLPLQSFAAAVRLLHARPSHVARPSALVWLLLLGLLLLLLCWC
jgi:hypothetical protein